MENSIKANKVSLLTIGTEVCSGEILNSNAQWLAAELGDLHFDVVRHVTVPDDALLMESSMDFCSKDCAIIIITGGLGPTRDDFTREIVSKWTARPLVFDEASWRHVSDRLTLINVPVAEANKQQCYFPKGAQVITNSAGTANAFALNVEANASPLIVCLPGPPAEIRAVWEDSLANLLRARAPKAAGTRLWYWHCIGLSESRLGEVVEEALQGSGYQTGYRPHIPYVDVKVWTPLGVNRSEDPYLSKLDRAIDRWTVTRDNEDVASTLIKLLVSRYQKCLLVDEITQGLLAARMGESWRISQSIDSPSSFELQAVCVIGGGQHTIALTPTEQTLTIVVKAAQPVGSWQIEIRQGARILKTQQLSFARKINRDTLSRYVSFVCEMTLATLVKELQ
jgi:nicotinamide-nucleotide amidase